VCGSQYQASSRWFWNDQRLLMKYSIDAYWMQFFKGYNLHIMPGVYFLGQKLSLAKDCREHPFYSV
jgi:hypothetical protein